MVSKEIPLHKESLAIERYTDLNIEVLENKQLNITDWLRDPNLLPRQHDEIVRILSHLAFELDMRSTTA